jgi:hypothetical protein
MAVFHLKTLGCNEENSGIHPRGIACFCQVGGLIAVGLWLLKQRSWQKLSGLFP